MEYIHRDEILRLVNIVMESLDPRPCKYCGSYHVVRFGRSKQRQRFLCRDCSHTYMDTDALPGMATPIQHIASALSMYYEGMSLNAIRRQLEQDHHNYPSDSTVYDWITKFSEVAIREASKHKPNVGDTWIADETVLKIEGKKVWFWDIIDAKTRFLLASHLSTTRTKRDARRLMEKAAEKAGKTPKVVITDRLASYLDGIELAFGADTKHIPSTPFTVEQSTNLIERFQGTLKSRTKVMRGLKKRKSAKLLTDGWLVHYNYFRPHESLGGKTPAEKAETTFVYKNWLDVAKSSLARLVAVKPRTTRMKLSTPFVPSAKPRRKAKRKSDGMYVGRGMVSRHPFAGGKRVRGRII